MENGVEIRRDQKRSDWIFRFIPILLIAFVLFFVFKLQGGWDVSSNFGVRTITASRDKGNVQAVIDGDEETVWGDGNYWEKEKAGDYICFFFSGEKEIRGVSIEGTHPDQLRFWYREDGRWREIADVSREGACYVFSEPVCTEEFQISTGEGAEKMRWNVREMVFYD